MKCVTLVLLGLASALAYPATFQSFTSSSNKFASSVYKEAASDTKGNLMLSPISAQIILSLSQSGAKGETASELQSALKLSSSKLMTDVVMKMVVEDLNEERDYVLRTVNKIYLKENSSANEDFEMIAKKVYGAEIESVDFTKPENAAHVMNQWVENNTDCKIRNLVDPEILGNKTHAILLNALRFKGNWSVPFMFLSTMKKDFHSMDSTIKVDTMHIMDEYLYYYEKPHLKATFLDLPIIGGNISLTIALPHARDGLALLEQHIDEVLQAPLHKHRDLFNVALPKFRMESRIDFKKILQNLGVKTAFEDGAADFSGITGMKGEMFIDDVVQKTFIDINEDGMEAAAATFVVKIVNRNGEMGREFAVDHPFLFFLKVDDLVIFVGRVVVPYY